MPVLTQTTFHNLNITPDTNFPVQAHTHREGQRSILKLDQPGDSTEPQRCEISTSLGSPPPLTSS